MCVLRGRTLNSRGLFTANPQQVLIDLYPMSKTDSRFEARVLVVDDEQAITDLLATVLRYEGFEVEAVHTGRAALDAVNTFRPDLILLDVQLPDIDGFGVQKRLVAERSRVPLLFLTARDAPEDKVRGLTMGGDDYVTKPFGLDELIARVRAVLRRTSGEVAAQRIRYGELELDEDTHEVFRGERSIELTPTEFALLRYLMVNAPRVMSKAQILDHVWRYDFDGDGTVVETYVSYLRRKIDREHGPDAEPMLRTVRGIGYSLRASR